MSNDFSTFSPRARQEATAPIGKVLARPGLEANSSPTSAEANALPLATRPRAGRRRRFNTKDISVGQTKGLVRVNSEQE